MTITSPDTSNAQKKPIPGWVGAAVIVACILFVGWFVWWYLFGSMPSEYDVAVDPALVQQENIRGAVRHFTNRAPQRITPTIKTDSADRWTLVSTAGGINIRKDKNDFRLHPFIYNPQLLDSAEFPVFTAFHRLRNDDAMAKQVGLSTDQVKQLRKIDLPGMKTSDADLTRLKQLWLTYIQSQKAARKDAEKKLLVAFDQIAKTDLAPTRQLMSQRITEIKQIITPKMIASLSPKPAK